MENHHPLQTIDKQAITAQKNHWILANGLFVMVYRIGFVVKVARIGV